MKNLLSKLNLFLSSLKTKDLVIKLSLLSVLFFVGCFCTPIFAVVFLLTAVFIILEKNVNSFLYILYLFPLMTLFSFNNDFGLTYWFLLVCVFVGVNLIVSFINFIKKKEKVNLPVAIILGVLALYLSIPFSGNIKFLSLLESYVWLSLFYIIFSKIKLISVKKQVVASSCGFLFSGFVGLFVKVIPYIASKIDIFYSSGLYRFSGALVNPNVYYSFGLLCLSVLIVLLINKKISNLYFILILPILIFCYATLSKTFILAYLIFVFAVGITTIIKFDKSKLKVFLYLLLCTIFTMLILFNYTKAYIDRFFNTNLMPLDEVVQLIPKSDKEAPKFVEVDTKNSEAAALVNTMTTGRLQVWKIYFNNIKEHDAFMFGFGINTANGLIYENTHNTYLQILYEVGIAGYLLLIAIAIYYIVKTKSMLFKKLDKGYWIPFVVLACDFMTENLFLSQLGVMLFLLACFALLIENKDAEDNIDKREVIEVDKKLAIKKEKADFKLAILTPSYNRPELLSKAYASLICQTCKDFVWYVIDDGSKESQEPIVNEFIKENIIEIKYIRKENGGKHTALNVGINNVNEPAVLILDNDDALTPNAVETIKSDWNLIKNREEICGIGYLRIKESGDVIGTQYSTNGVVDSFVNERYNNNTFGDKSEVYKTEILKKFPFPVFKGENFLSESTVWCKMSGSYKFLFINKGLYICNYQEDGLSNGIQKRLLCNPKGATECYKTLTTKEFNLKNRIKFTLLYILHAFAAKYKIKEIITKSNNKILTILLLPFGYALYLYRRRRFK